jgi:hypothetical protein
MTNPPDREVAVFSAVRQLPASERGAFLDKECAGDTDLRGRTEELIQASEVAGAFLESPASGPGGTVRITATPTEKPGDRIGRYKLLQQIGEGGCGVVYMAEQEEPVKRRVALKVIAILAAMLLPALSRSKLKATEAACLSNEKQLAYAYVMYADDNTDLIVPMVTGQYGTAAYQVLYQAGGFWKGPLLNPPTSVPIAPTVATPENTA